MKRLSLVPIILSLFLTVYLLPVPTAQAQSEIPVLVDGLPVDFDVEPVIQKGRVLVPFRLLAEALNVEVNWDGNTQTVTAADGQNSLRLQINNQTAYRNGNPLHLDVPPAIIEGRTLVPLRFFGEALNCEVNWVEAQHRVQVTSAPRAMTAAGFYALGDRQTSSWTNLFREPYPHITRGNTDVVNELALGWYSLNEKGNLLTESRTGWQRPGGWENVLEAAERYRLGTEMVIHATNKDGILASFLADPSAVNRAVKDIAAEANLYKGVNLDLEGLGLSQTGESLQELRQDFTSFVRLLSEELKANRKNLTLTLHAPNSAYQGYDYRELGKLADRIIIMAYDYGPKPEPVNQVRQAVEMALDQVPSEKLVLGISAPNETAESLLVKIGIAKRYNLNGIAIWRLGLVTGDMWEAMRTTILTQQL